MDVSSRLAALGATPPHRTVTLDGVSLALDDAGSGPPVVCLHAIGHGASDFAGLRARLAGRYRMVAPDWPGHGRSGPDREPPGAARYEALVARLVDALGLDAVVLVGNSIGGAAAIRYAASHPARVRGLVLEDPGGLVPVGRTVRAFTDAFARFFAAGARGARWFPAAFALYYRIVLRAPAAAPQRRRIVAASREIAPLLAAAWRGFGQPDADLRALAPRIGCPVLFCWARHDRVIPLARCRPAIRTFPDATLETFDAGHAAHLEAPDAFAASLERFLARLPAAAPAPAASQGVAR
jgi:pimeloyl-ACP methyl ester carboxylesterase